MSCIARNYPGEIEDFGRLLLLGYQKGYLVMVGAYVDESGDPENAKCSTLVLSGWYTTPRDWKNIVKEWMGIVRRCQVVSFHTTDCANGQKEFEGWSETRKKNIFKNLLNILSNHSDLKGCSAAVALQDYREVVSPEANQLFGGPRGLAFQLLLQSIGKRTGGFPVVFVVDRPPKGWGVLDELFEKTKALPTPDNWNKSLLGLTPGNAKDFPAIQTADLLAYETYRHLNKIVKGEVHRKMRKSLVRIILEKAPIGKYFEKKSLLALINQCKKDGKLAA
jgi:hypothetical protein